MAFRKDVKGFGMPWEDQDGYVQALNVEDTIYVSFQLSQDEQGVLFALPRSMAQSRSRWLHL